MIYSVWDSSAPAKRVYESQNISFQISCLEFYIIFMTPKSFIGCHPQEYSIPFTFSSTPPKNVVEFEYDKRRRDVYERQLKRGF